MPSQVILFTIFVFTILALVTYTDGAAVCADRLCCSWCGRHPATAGQPHTHHTLWPLPGNFPGPEVTPGLLPVISHLQHNTIHQYNTILTADTAATKLIRKEEEKSVQNLPPSYLWNISMQQSFFLLSKYAIGERYFHQRSFVILFSLIGSTSALQCS